MFATWGSKFKKINSEKINDTKIKFCIYIRFEILLFQRNVSLNFYITFDIYYKGTQS